MDADVEGSLVVPADSTAEEGFPMWCVGMDIFLQLRLLRSHGQLQQEGALQQPAQQDIVHFMSHEWLHKAHPDPHGVQLERAQAIFFEIASGRGAELFFPAKWDMFRTGRLPHERGDEQARTKQLTASAFAEDVADGVVWVDFASIPQLCDVAPGGDLSRQIHDQQKAISSISMYIDRASYLWIVAPTSQHADKQSCRDFTTYRKRAWCRLEESVNLLSSSAIMPLVVTEKKRLTSYTFNEYMMELAAHPHRGPHAGVTTCCEMGHTIMQEGIAKRIPCDKVQMLVVLKRMYTIRLDTLLMERSWRSALSMVAAAPSFLAGDELADYRNHVRQQVWQCIPEEAKAKLSMTPLCYAVLCNDLDGVHELLAALDGSLSFDTASMSSITWPLRICASAGRLEIADLLRARNAMAIEDLTGLLWAANKGHQGMVERLLCWRADVNGKQEHSWSFVGTTSLHLASLSGHVACCEMLLRHRADFCACTTIGMTPLHYAVVDPLCPTGDASPDSATQVFRLLLAARADTAVKDTFGHTPLDIAAVWDLSL